MKSCFSAAHREGDLDCFGDLKYLTRNDIKKAMKFSEDDLLYASNLEFLVTSEDCTRIAGKALTEPVAWLIERTKLSTLLAKEEKLEVQHPTKKHKYEHYRNIVLIKDREPRFISAQKTWFNLGVYFFLPKQARLILVSVHHCLSCFTKPQQANIVRSTSPSASRRPANSWGPPSAA